MTRHHLLAAAASALMISTAACQVASTPKKNGAEATSSEQGAADRLARVDMQVDTSYLSGEERQVVNLLIQGSVYMLLAMAEVFALLLGEIDLSIGFVSGIGGIIDLINRPVLNPDH